MKPALGAFCLCLLGALFCALQLSLAEEGTGKSAGQTVLRYEPAVVRLEGIVEVKSSFGPPNYDETSPVERWSYLRLKKTITVVGSKTDELNAETETSVTEVQLVLEHGAHSLVGKHVIMEGTLFHAYTGHHHAQVLLTPTKVTISP